MEHISNTGWIVIAFIAVLIFTVIMMRGISFDWNGKKGIIGKEKERFDDQEKQQDLFRKVQEIDESCKADKKMAVKRLKGKLKSVFEPYIHCSMPAITVFEIILDVFEDRVERNCMRQKLTKEERSLYIADILYYIETDYEQFLQNIPATPCHAEQYPDWNTIKPSIESITQEWADDIAAIIVKRCQEKIALYETEQHVFKKDYYKKRCIDYPLEKNKRYIAALQTSRAVNE